MKPVEPGGHDIICRVKMTGLREIIKDLAGDVLLVPATPIISRPQSNYTSTSPGGIFRVRDSWTKSSPLTRATAAPRGAEQLACK